MEPVPAHPNSPDYKINMEIGELGRIIGCALFDESHRMTDFCLTAQVYHADAWWDVVRVDTKHGAVHAHHMYRTRADEEPEEIKPIYGQDDVDSGYQLAETLLIANWADHVTRWNRGS